MKKDLNNTIPSRIWVLIDDRIGNANQALALAAGLSNDYQVKHIKYNKLGNLPNFLLKFWMLHVKKSVLHELISQDMPEIIISAGRRTSSVAVYLKKISKKEIKIIQIMRPCLDPKEFELIILPQHDNYKYTLPNVVRIIGALSNVQTNMPKAKELLRTHYPDIKNFIAVIIGGSTKKYKFTFKNALSLVNILNTVVSNHSLPLFITFSRRTTKEIKNLFKEKFILPNVIYDPEDNLPNPYPGIIGEAEYIITTADSISMCSEAASTSKPMYVFCPENFTLKKHKFFIQQLVDLDIARRLEHNTDFLVKYNYEPLNEVDKVLKIIRKKLFL